MPKCNCRARVWAQVLSLAVVVLKIVLAFAS